MREVDKLKIINYKILKYETKEISNFIHILNVPFHTNEIFFNKLENVA